MSEYGPKPESTESRIVELRAVYTELDSLENMMAKVENGNLERLGNDGAIKAIRDRQIVLKQRAYKLHLALKDYEGIRGTLVDVIKASQKERDDLGRPYYIEEVADEAFAIETECRDLLDPTVQEMLQELTEKYSLMTLDENSE